PCRARPCMSGSSVPMAKIRVLVVDDSALVRSLLQEIINQQADMVCAGVAANGLLAREMIRQLNPDVLTLDVEMPGMDGLDFLARLMRLRPMPVVMISAFTTHTAETTLQALELGALDFVAKPQIGVADGLRDLAVQIVDKIRIAGLAKVRRLPMAVAADTPAAGRSVSPPLPVPGALAWHKLIAVGASTGGTEALRRLLPMLPADSPAVVITQHMPPGFTAGLATRLDKLCQIRVKEASHGERILPGHAYIAPGGKQFSVARSGGHYVAMVQEGDLVNRHRPSVEVLFKSCAQFAGPNAYGVMLTGMGADGALAMKQMRDQGSYNCVQDEASCVVFGMPREAILAGAAHQVLPLDQIVPALLLHLAQARTGSPAP
ncbi:MAG: hypothetical protein RLZZ401_1418, partial [Pseudomonadota bacterium]